MKIPLEKDEMVVAVDNSRIFTSKGRIYQLSEEFKTGYIDGRAIDSERVWVVRELGFINAG